ncbi:SusC/RagA family TonB-linked outer membrane protein [Bacteroides stercoris]|jgi:TonB-linked SusC/RagA family outer membrane protein|uniref:TonB-dependent receptor plug domain protein n=1 Tax=Bacteroides stercoris TaxID=46506 RepID=A0A108TC05_BACSE|nr:TonB-dependent receptor [Bacteroides stercoris]KWR57215.1 TonB-dependent receptor plug domain protein [Bacteroides stercoris]
MKQVNLRICRTILPLLLGLFLSVGVYAQNITVKGHVKDALGGVIGANVVEKGNTTNGTITDLDGNFTLTVPQGATLVVSFIGYKSQEVAAAPSVVVTLQDDAELLETVVVIGYGSVKKNDLTGSVTAIKADEINRGAITSPDQMLQGKVPGLLVTPASGDPTGGATIRIRGAASLYASNDPLIVIDGVPVTSEGGAGMANPLASVNPNDIESYTVLKDASATAIYGSRASNGVIIITTKKGTGDKMKVSYNSSYSLKQNTSTLEMMTGDQYRQYIKDVYGENDPRLGMMGNANTDWQDLIYRTAFSTDQNVSLYGNAKGVLPYRVSLGYTYDQATLKEGDNQRANLGISLSPKFFQDHLSVNVNLKGIYNRANYPNSGAVGSAVDFDPTQSPYFYDANGNIDTSKAGGYFNWINADGSANTMASINPLSQLYDNYNVNDTWRSMGNVQLDYKIHGFEDLRVNLNLGYDLARTEGTKYSELGSILSMRNGAQDYYENYANNNANTLLEFYANYNKEFGIHHLDVMAGYSWQHNYVKYDNIQYYNNDRSNVYLDNPTDRKEYYLVSFFGRVNYSLNSKYLFTVSLRDDASSRFSKSNRWGLFPSAAFAWNIAEENFLKESDTPISSLKLRLGWGQTGQQDIGIDRCYAYQAKYTQSSALATRIPWGNGYIYTLAPNAYNPDIKWETTETYNVGLDFGFLKGRINGTIDAYLRKTKDLLNDVTTPMGVNFSNKVISNVGDMENKGLEFNLNFIPIERKDMRWTINVNGTWQDTKITKLTNNPTPDYLGVEVGANMGGTGGYTSLYSVGYSPYTYHLYQQAYDENGKPLQNVLVDRDGNGEITAQDRYITDKSIQPKFFYGIGSQFTYKNWDFGFNAHGSVGGYALNRIKMNTATSYSDDYTKGYLNNLSPYCMETGWTATISEQQKYSDMFLENTTFFRMDDINVGYTFDKIKNWNGKIRVAASVQNVFTITKYSGLDPELTAVDGVDNNLIPRPRLYTLRLNINF